jgi:uncharacterized protein YggE
MPATQTRLALVVIAAIVAVASVFAAGAAAVGGGGGRTAYAATTAATTSSAQTGVAVSGRGEAPGTPDVLRLDLSITTSGTSAGQALDRSSALMSKVLKALKDKGTKKADIRTSGLSLQPNYDYRNGKQRITGYSASNSVAATLRDLSKAGAVIQAAVTAGGDASRLDGVRLDLDSDKAVVAAARTAAFADAKAKAEAYAKAAGRDLGPVTLVTENVNPAQPIDMRQAFSYAASAPAALPVPVEPGSATVGVTVQVVWSFA